MKRLQEPKKKKTAAPPPRRGARGRPARRRKAVTESEEEEEEESEAESETSVRKLLKFISFSTVAMANSFSNELITKRIIELLIYSMK